MVISQYGIVAADSPLAGQAGVRMLEQGGTAVDAAVAANAVMGVVAPMLNGIGGDLCCLVYDAVTETIHGLNATGPTPAGLTIAHLQRNGFSRMPEAGIHTVTVPGAVEGWDQLLRRFGTKPLAAVLSPAIRVAEEGSPVTEVIAALWQLAGGSLQDHHAREALLVHGYTPRVGEVFSNPDLAWSYRQLAEYGRNAFYQGTLAQRILDLVRRCDGVMNEEDLASYHGEWTQPLATMYRGWTVHEMPPNTQGIAALEMLNIMEASPLSEYGPQSPETLHVMIEAKKLAYADLIASIGDSDQSRMKVGELLSKEYARERAATIDLTRARAEGSGEAIAPGGTTYVAAVDRTGNLVSLIQSNYYSHTFGSGLVPRGTGFALHNRGALFSLDPASPNGLAGRKRPLHPRVARTERSRRRIPCPLTLASLTASNACASHC